LPHHEQLEWHLYLGRRVSGEFVPGKSIGFRDNRGLRSCGHPELVSWFQFHERIYGLFVERVFSDQLDPGIFKATLGQQHVSHWASSLSVPGRRDDRRAE
jgi:hypothetical protein